jgi:hypothetical protein
MSESDGDHWELNDKRHEAAQNKQIAPYNHQILEDPEVYIIYSDSDHKTKHIISDYTVPVRR